MSGRSHPATQEVPSGELPDAARHSRTMLDAPIFVAGRMVGSSLSGTDRRPRVWEVDEELFVGSIADMVAMALESSRLITRRQSN